MPVFKVGNIQWRNWVLVQIRLLCKLFSLNTIHNNNSWLLKYRVPFLTIAFFESQTCVIEWSNEICCFFIVKVNDSNLTILEQKEVLFNRTPKCIPNLIKRNKPDETLTFILDDLYYFTNYIILFV